MGAVAYESFYYKVWVRSKGGFTEVVVTWTLNRLPFVCLSVIFPWLRLQVTWLEFILMFCAVLKVFCASVSGKYVFLYKYRKNSFGKIITGVKIGIFPIPIAYWSGFGIFKQNRDVWTVCILTNLSRLRKQPIFRDASTGFLPKGRLRNEHRISILMTCH